MCCIFEQIKKITEVFALLDNDVVVCGGRCVRAYVPTSVTNNNQYHQFSMFAYFHVHVYCFTLRCRDICYHSCRKRHAAVL
jgi:hypothetical protein